MGNATLVILAAVLCLSSFVSTLSIVPGGYGHYPRCRKNERWARCGKRCSCYTLPWVTNCRTQCTPYGRCFCISNFVWDHHSKRCVPEEFCQNCGENEVLSDCGITCTCAHKADTCTQVCAKGGKKACFCKPGFVRSRQYGKCVKKEDCDEHRYGYGYGYGYKPYRPYGYGYKPYGYGYKPYRPYGYGYKPYRLYGYGYKPYRPYGYGYKPYNYGYKSYGYGYKPYGNGYKSYGHKPYYGYGYKSYGYGYPYKHSNYNSYYKKPYYYKSYPYNYPYKYYKNQYHNRW